jgi:hypothetical protein
MLSCHNATMSPSAEPTDAGVVLVLNRSVKPGCEAQYSEWLERVKAAEKQAEGFRGREDFPPINGHQAWWTSVIRFDTEANLDRWVNSATGQALIREVEPLCLSVSKSRINTGFDAWFATAAPDKSPGHGVPPTWKMTLAVVLALYPSIFLISWLFTSRVHWPFALKLLVSNLLAVTFVSWVSLPIVRRILGGWFAPTSSASPAVNVGGTLGIVVALLLMLWLFLSIPLG